MFDPTKAVAAAEQSLTGPGDWLDGSARRAAWLEVRDARTNELDRRRRAAVSPFAGGESHEPVDGLGAAAVDVVHRIASDPGRLNRSWADEMIAELGDATYTELVGVTAIAMTVDTYRRALGDDVAQIGEVLDGEPACVRPADVGDVGAWVPQSETLAAANVSRAISLAPTTNRQWVSLVNSLYSRGEGFYDLAWQRPLSRPQVEAVAARTTAELECFY